MTQSVRWPAVAFLGVLGFFALAVLGFAIWIPTVLSDNTQAQGAINVIISAVATAVGVIATRYYASAVGNMEINRYGLLAWRTLNALYIKVMHFQEELDSGKGVSPDQMTHRIDGWLLDIDNAKIAWRDLLKDAFELRERLQQQSYEVAEEYQDRIQQAKDEHERHQLAQERDRRISALASQSPLPIASPTIQCPECGETVQHNLSPTPGTTQWPQCGSCKVLIPIHRMGDGSIKVSDGSVQMDVPVRCPHCTDQNLVRLPKYKEVAFARACTQCGEMIQFSGNGQRLQASQELRPPEPGESRSE